MTMSVRLSHRQCQQGPQNLRAAIGAMAVDEGLFSRLIDEEVDGIGSNLQGK